MSGGIAGCLEICATLPFELSANANSRNLPTEEAPRLNNRDSSSLQRSDEFAALHVLFYRFTLSPRLILCHH